MLIDSVSTRVSLIDGLPIGYSPAHKLLRSLLNCAAAGLTYEEEIRLHPPDEVMPSDTIRISYLDMGAQRRYQLPGRYRVSSQTKHTDSLQTSWVG